MGFSLLQVVAGLLIAAGDADTSGLSANPFEARFDIRCSIKQAWLSRVLHEGMAQEQVETLLGDCDPRTMAGDAFSLELFYPRHGVFVVYAAHRRWRVGETPPSPKLAWFQVQR
jgi:hypothetical protein